MIVKTEKTIFVELTETEAFSVNEFLHRNMPLSENRDTIDNVASTLADEIDFKLNN